MEFGSKNLFMLYSHVHNSQVMECLRKHFHRLSKPCGAVLAPKQVCVSLTSSSYTYSCCFLYLQVTANKDARVDYVLMKSCKDGIEVF